mmetsp:Transcript_15132/g.39865  ORF Transcript_15132/g.39865 Transcript_15132/m.39865 type:complete len:130 (-) Transcript_15132:577-966(-)
MCYVHVRALRAVVCRSTRRPHDDERARARESRWDNHGDRTDRPGARAGGQQNRPETAPRRACGDAPAARHTADEASGGHLHVSTQMTLCLVVPVGGTCWLAARAASSAAARASFLLRSSSMDTPCSATR